MKATTMFATGVCAAVALSVAVHAQRLSIAPDKPWWQSVDWRANIGCVHSPSLPVDDETITVAGNLLQIRTRDFDSEWTEEARPRIELVAVKSWRKRYVLDAERPSGRVSLKRVTPGEYYYMAGVGFGPGIGLGIECRYGRLIVPSRRNGRDVFRIVLPLGT